MRDVWPNVLGGLTEALVGGLIGFLIAYFAFRLRTRKVVEYNVLSMPLLGFKPIPERPILVSVDKAILTGNEADTGDFVEVDSAYGFEVEVQNVGNQPIENCIIEIQLDEQAQIIEFETQPDSRPGFPITTERDSTHHNVLRISPPYINAKDTVLARIISTGNASRDCEVDVIGLAVRVRKRTELREMIWPMAVMFLTMVIVGIFYSPQWWPSMRPVIEPLVELLGGKMKQSFRPALPIWLQLILFLPFLLAYMWFLYSLVAIRQRKRELKKGGWDLKPAKKSTLSVLFDFLSDSSWKEE